MEIFAAERQIRSLLKAIMPVGTPVEPAPYPETKPYPAVIYKLLAPEADTIVLGGTVVMSNLIYEVVVVAPSDNIGVCHDYVKWIDLALHNKGGSNADGVVFSITRQRPMSVPFRSESGKTFQMIGFMYQVVVKGA